MLTNTERSRHVCDQTSYVCFLLRTLCENFFVRWHHECNLWFRRGFPERLVNLWKPAPSGATPLKTLRAR